MNIRDVANEICFKIVNESLPIFLDSAVSRWFSNVKSSGVHMVQIGGGVAAVIISTLLIGES